MKKMIVRHSSQFQKGLFNSTVQAAVLENIEIDRNDILNCEIVAFEEKKKKGILK